MLPCLPWGWWGALTTGLKGKGLVNGRGVESTVGLSQTRARQTIHPPGLVLGHGCWASNHTVNEVTGSI